MNLNEVLLLAGEQPPQGGGDPGAVWQLLLPPMIILFVMYQFMVARPQRKEQRRREDMLKQLKKNDPVVTIGGILGTVANLSDDGTEVTVKVDDNTRLRFRRDAIREVVVKNPPAASTSAAPAKS
jgi:preprotein translocase subunit YajC